MNFFLRNISKRVVGKKVISTKWGILSITTAYMA